MDRLMREVNNRAEALGIRMQYSTLSRYFKSVSVAAKGGLTFPRYTGDFFPYADNADSFWTGYYTSRPTLKGVARMAESSIRAAESLMVFARAYTDASDLKIGNGGFGALFRQLQVARRGANLAQHHDGLTGTSKAPVVTDYMSKLDNAIRVADSVSVAMQTLLLSNRWQRQPKPPGSPAVEVTELLDGTKRIAVLLHNTLGWTRTEVVQVMVTSSNVAVYDPDGSPLGHLAQVRPGWHWDKDAGKLKASPSSFQVSFVAEVPALGMATYLVDTAPATPENNAKPALLTVYEKCNNQAAGASKIRGADPGAIVYQSMEQPIVLQNDKVSLTLSTVTGLPKTITSKTTQVPTEIDQSFLIYQTQQSGAYIFRSAGDAQVLPSGCTTLGVSRGSVTEDALIKVSGGIGLKASLDAGQAHVDLDVSVTPGSNQEVITRFSTQVENPNGRFYVDNAVRMIARQRNPTIPASYYPMVHRASIQDQAHKLTVISSQALGVSSLSRGQLELMLHRNLAQDDGRGMGEGLTDGATANMMLRLVTNEDADELRSTRHSFEMNNLLTSGMRQITWPPAQSISEFRDRVITRWSPLKAQLPYDLHLLALAPRDATSSTVVLQLNRISGKGLDPSKVDWTTVDLHNLFTDFTPAHLQERTLSLHSHPITAHENTPHFDWASRNSSNWEALAFGPAAQALGKTGSTVSQNTNEEGVFISHAALKKVGKPFNPQPRPPGARRLLAARSQKLTTAWPILKPELLSVLLSLVVTPTVQEKIFLQKQSDPIPVLIKLASRPAGPPPTPRPTIAPPNERIRTNPQTANNRGRARDQILEELQRVQQDPDTRVQSFLPPAAAPRQIVSPPVNSGALRAAALDVTRLEAEAAEELRHAEKLEHDFGFAPTSKPEPPKKVPHNRPNHRKERESNRYWWLMVFFITLGPLMFFAVICYGVWYGRAAGKSARARN
eukprot:TRINITY_DN10710_c0_g1_i3.p1 TRINITY_DN10710_c0_g1~~TRINITY_DN10710_c0_g1_i3.p1  ORF type:complete len:952 (-),score=172.96 TRINITY_DN10710_c0_g1_i3:18-2873(-)